jgi:hypothetical protein
MIGRMLKGRLGDNGPVAVGVRSPRGCRLCLSLLVPNVPGAEKMAVEAMSWGQAADVVHVRPSLRVVSSLRFVLALVTAIVIHWLMTDD